MYEIAMEANIKNLLIDSEIFKKLQREECTILNGVKQNTVKIAILPKILKLFTDLVPYL